MPWMATRNLREEIRKKIHCDELVELKNREEDAQRMVQKLRSENRSLREPLHKIQKKVAGLEQQLFHYKRDKAALMDMHKRLSKMTKEMAVLSFERDALQLELDKANNEIEEMKSNYNNTLVEYEQKTGLEITELENKITLLESQLETREVQIAHVVSKSNLDPEEVINACKKIELLLDKKDRHLDSTRLELGRVMKAHDDLLTLIQSHAPQLVHGVNKMLSSPS